MTKENNTLIQHGLHRRKHERTGRCFKNVCELKIFNLIFLYGKCCILTRHVSGLPFKNLKHPRISKNGAVMKTLKKQKLGPKKLFQLFSWKLTCLTVCLIKILLKFVPKSPINNKPSWVQIMAGGWTGIKPYLNQWWATFLMHICFIQPQ